MPGVRGRHTGSDNEKNNPQSRFPLTAFKNTYHIDFLTNLPDSPFLKAEFYVIFSS